MAPIRMQQQAALLVHSFDCRVVDRRSRVQAEDRVIILGIQTRGYGTCCSRPRPKGYEMPEQILSGWKHKHTKARINQLPSRVIMSNIEQILCLPEGVLGPLAL